MTKRVLITGAASGLGRELALNYGAQGDSVAVADINQQRAGETVALIEARGGNACALSLDDTDIEHFESAKKILVEQWGGVDVLINNAGVASAGNFAEIPITTWDWMLGINLMGVVKGCKVFTPLFQQQGSGHFVNCTANIGKTTIEFITPV